MINRVVPYLGLEWEAEQKNLSGNGSDDPGVGVIVKRVVPNSPASRAGVQAGDKLRRVDGSAVNAESTLSRLIESRKPGAVVTLAVRRGEKKLNIRVTLGERRIPLARRAKLESTAAESG